MPKTDIDISRRRAFLRKLWALTWPYFRSEEKWRAGGLLLVIVGLSLGLVYVNVQITYWYNDFYNALQNKDVHAFWYQIGKFSVLATAYIVVAVYYTYLQQMLQIYWRRWMTDRMLGRWLADRAYYSLQLGAERADNPEQRIEADISLFTDGALDLTLGLLNAVVTLVSFVTILWIVSGPLSFSAMGMQITIPGYMVWAALLYAAVGSLLTYWVGRPLIRTNFLLQKFNASFRFGMSRLRENAESVAFYGGEAAERQRLMLNFGDIWTMWWQLMRQQKRLTWLVSGYGQIAIIFPILVAAPRYFAGAIQLGGLMQIRAAFGQVQDSLSWFVNAFNTLAEWKATVDRLTGFVGALERTKALKTGFAVTTGATPGLEAHDIDLRLPDGRVLIHDLNVDIHAGEKVLISGPSGAGKTTLFRALAGIWPFGKGRIRKPSGGRTLFLPQRPYLPIGTLREAIAYPALPADLDDHAIRAALTDVNLERLRDRLDDKQNWTMALSIGEQQRLAIARALLLKPDWLYLDEATAALDAPNEQRMYALLTERLPNATVLSIAHRGEVARYHNRRLDIDPDARVATLSPISTG
jgi:putative ATP-binding cassette transporter